MCSRLWRLAEARRLSSSLHNPTDDDYADPFACKALPGTVHAGLKATC
jgi:hypothetical protein